MGYIIQSTALAGMPTGFDEATLAKIKTAAILKGCINIDESYFKDLTKLYKACPTEALNYAMGSSWEPLLDCACKLGTNPGGGTDPNPNPNPNPVPAQTGTDWIAENKDLLLYGGIGLAALLILYMATKKKKGRK